MSVRLLLQHLKCLWVPGGTLGTLEGHFSFWASDLESAAAFSFSQQ